MYRTVDGRNPAPVDMQNVPLFTGFYTFQLVQDFFHQQYVYLPLADLKVNVGKIDHTHGSFGCDTTGCLGEKVFDT